MSLPRMYKITLFYINYVAIFKKKKRTPLEIKIKKKSGESLISAGANAPSPPFPERFFATAMPSAHFPDTK